MSTLKLLRQTRDSIENRSNTSASEVVAQRNIPLDSLIAANAMPVVSALLLVWLATVGLCIITSVVPLNLVPLAYMLPVVFASTRWGIVPGLVAAFAGAAAADFFFYAPLYSFWLESRQDFIDLSLYLVVAAVTSKLVARLRNAAGRSARSETLTDARADPHATVSSDVRREAAHAANGGSPRADGPDRGTTISLRLPTLSDDAPAHPDAMNA